MQVWTWCDNVASNNPVGTTVASPMVFDSSGKSYTFKNLTAGTAAAISIYNQGIYGPYGWNSYAGGFIFDGIKTDKNTVWEIHNITDNVKERFEVTQYRTATGPSVTADEIKGFVFVRKCGTLDFNVTIEQRVYGVANNGSLANNQNLIDCDYEIFQGAVPIVASTPMVACINDHQSWGKDASFSLPNVGAYTMVVKIKTINGNSYTTNLNFTVAGSTLCTVPDPPKPPTCTSVSTKNNGNDLVYFEPKCGTASGTCANAGYEVGLLSGCGIWKKKDGTVITAGNVLFDGDFPLKLDPSGCGHGDISELPFRVLTTGGCGAGEWAILKSYTIATPAVSISSIRNPCTNVCECVAVITGLVPDLTDVLIYDATTAVDFDSPATNLIASANMISGTATVIVPCSAKIKAYFKF